MLLAEGLTKEYEGQAHPALDRADLEVRDGEILGLVGLNGAGKTTTIRIAAGIVLPTAGRATVDGLDIVREKRAASARIGWVPELFPFEPNARALPLLVYYAGFQGIRGPSARRECRELIARVGLSEVENGRIRTFSQGMKKRFALATAMIGDPPNLLLDEILNGLDPEGIAFVRRWTTEQRRQGKAVLLSSHLLGELQALADRVTIVHHGRILRTIDRNQLAEAGEIELRIVVEPIDEALLTYLRTVGTVRSDGAAVVVAGPTAPSESINEALVRRGYRVRELKVESTSLESYFLRLVGAGT